jgi:Holliday junction resolvase YEN1
VHPNIGLTRGGLILIGLLSGGDYHQAGLARCGTKIAHGLAKCGFGDSLFQAASTLSRQELSDYLIVWREQLRHELLTNSQGILGKKFASLANSVPNDFPDIDIVLSYTDPITSETEGRAMNNFKITWSKEPDLGKLANICELYFEWGVKDIIIKRFRTVIWPSAVLRIMRRRVLDADNGLDLTPISTIGKSKEVENLGNERLVVKIHSTRSHASTDGILEYRLEVSPSQLLNDCEAGILGIRPPIEDDEWDDEEDKKVKKPPPDPQSHLRIWIPASLVQIIEPDLVNDFESIQETRQAKTTGKRRDKVLEAKATALASEGSASDPEPSAIAVEAGALSPKYKKVPEAKAKVVVTTAVQEDDGVSSDSKKKASKDGAFKNRVPNGPCDNDLRKDMKSFYPVSKGTTHSVKHLGSKVVNASPLPTPSKSTKPSLLNEAAIDLRDICDLPSSTQPLTVATSKYSTTVSLPSGSQNGSFLPLSVVPHPTAPKPFPMDDPYIEYSNMRAFISPRKRSRQIALLSSPEYDSLNRLARISSEHSSPRSKRTSKLGEQENGGGQGSNPLLSSPSRQSRHTTKPSSPAATKTMGVIDISSDSDTPPLTTATRAKAKQSEQLAQKSSREPTIRMKSKKAGLPMPEIMVDFIDLT